MKNVLLPLLVFISAVLTSCKAEEKFSDELKIIDKSEAKLDSLAKVIENIEYDSLTYMVTTCKKNLEEATKYYSLDTIDQSFAQQITLYKGVKKGVPSGTKKKKEWDKEIEVLRNQFLTLEEDAKNGVYSKEKLNEYLKSELASLNDLELDIKSFQMTYNSVASVFRSYNDKVEAYIEELKKEKTEVAL